MKKRYKIALSVVAIGCLASLGGTAYVIDQLPSPRKLSQALDQVGAPQSTPTTVATTPSAAPTAAAAKGGAAPTTTSPETLKVALLNLTTADKTDVRVCENLGHSRVVGPDGKLKDMNIDALISPEARTDSVAEAMRYPIITMFQDEDFASLIQDVATPEAHSKDKAERESFFEKVGFYARATKTVAKMYARKNEFEAMGDRANHLAVLAKLAIRKPELVGTTALMDVCENMQRTLGETDRADVKAERQQLLALLAEHGVKPSEVDFDPEAYMKFKAEFGGNQLSFTLTDKEAKAQ
jgi:hypothetical protein